MRDWTDISTGNSPGRPLGVDESYAIEWKGRGVEEEGSFDARVSDDSDYAAEGSSSDEGSIGDPEVELRVPREYG